MVDNASGLVHVEHQKHLNTHETLEAIKSFEQMCLDYGVVPTEYVSDSGSAFTSKEYQAHLANYQQIISFAGTGAHHHNAIAERSIRTIMSIARTCMLHAAIHWPEMADATLWPLAVDYAVYIYNRVPNRETGLSPLDIFSNQRQPQRRLQDLHVWGSPAYLLDKRIADGKKIPRWESKSERVIFVGISPKHLGATPRVLNPRTRAITTPYNVVFDDWFATVGSKPEDLPDFNSPEWQRLFGDSEYQYVEDEDWISQENYQQTPPPNPIWDRRERVATSLSNLYHPQQQVPMPVPSSSVRYEFYRENPALPPAPPVPQRPPFQRENLPGPNEPAGQTQQPRAAPREEAPIAPMQPAPAQVSPAPARTPNTSGPPQMAQAPAAAPTPAPAHPQEAPTRPRRLTGPERELRDLHEVADSMPVRERRTRRPPVNYEPEVNIKNRKQRNLPKVNIHGVVFNVQGNALISENQDYIYEFPAAYACTITGAENPFSALSEVYKASKTDPDSVTLEQALSDPTHYHEWVKALKKEIGDLERHGTWEEVPIEEAEGDVVPVHWVLRIKRGPDGTFEKFKARIVVRGDLMHNYDFETHAPTCQWSVIRMVLILALTWGWTTCTCDYSNAFIHAKLDTPVWIHLPRGFRSTLPGRTCLKLKRSLYGTSFAGKLWSDCLTKALLDYGLEQCTLAGEPCLFAKPGMMAVVHVDDLVLCFKDPKERDVFLKKMREYGFTLEMDRSLEAFLGIKFERLPDDSFNMTQPALIDKILQHTGMENCNSSTTPAAPNQPLGKDPEGEPMSESWDYRATVGMLLYLSTNTRPDITYAVSQVARFTHDPKQSHAQAVKRIVRYLKGTQDKGTIMKPDGTLAINCMSDADFAGLFKHEPMNEKSSAKSRMGWIISLGGCPLIWKSKLIDSICLATAEAEYYSLSQCLRALIPIRRILEDLCKKLAVPLELQATISSKAFEDNSSALLLARDHRLTSRTRYFHTQSHHFWQHVDNGTVLPVACATADMDADYMTKGMYREGFETNRKRVQGW
jgi:hypothetical protein